MKTFVLEDNEIDVIREALKRMDKDCHFDLITFSRHENLDAMSECVDILSCISFLLHKITF